MRYERRGIRRTFHTARTGKVLRPRRLSRIGRVRPFRRMLAGRSGPALLNPQNVAGEARGVAAGKRCNAPPAMRFTTRPMPRQARGETKPATRRQPGFPCLSRDGRFRHMASDDWRHCLAGGTGPGGNVRRRHSEAGVVRRPRCDHQTGRQKPKSVPHRGIVVSRPPQGKATGAINQAAAVLSSLDRARRGRRRSGKSRRVPIRPSENCRRTGP